VNGIPSGGENPMKWFGSRREKSSHPASAYPTLATDRLILRMFEPADAADVYAYAQNPAVGPAAGWAPHHSLTESQQVVRRFISHGDVWAIEERKTGKVIGSIGLSADAKRDVDNARTLGYALGEPYWGRGYATEAASAVLRFAFTQLQCPVLSVFHYPGNTRSQRVIKNLGFVREGILRSSYTLADGSLSGEVCYSLTREEYLSAQPNANKTAGNFKIMKGGRTDAAVESL
jgi:[ribosomal protein S5]-alanine N-acetyltransferase